MSRPWLPAVLVSAAMTIAAGCSSVTGGQSEVAHTGGSSLASSPAVAGSDAVTSPGDASAQDQAPPPTDLETSSADLTSAAHDSSSPAEPIAGRLGVALGYVPDTASEFTYYDTRALKAAWGISDLDSTVPGDDPAWRVLRDHAGDMPLGDLAAVTELMAQTLGWSAVDVDWEITSATPGTGAGQPVAVYRLNDEVDMDRVIDGFSADNGFTRSGSDAAATFTIDNLAAAGALGGAFTTATVIPAEHVVITGDPAELGAAAEGASVAGSAPVQALLAGIEEPRFVRVQVGDDACMPAREVSADLAAVDGWAAAVTGDDHGVLTVGVSDDGGVDLAARTTVLEEGRSLGGEPLAHLFTVTGGGSEHHVERFEVAFTGSAGVLAQMVASRDTPWAVCG